jgi:hypothetical protein
MFSEQSKLNVPKDDGELMLGPSIADVMLRECTCVLVVLALLHGNDIRHTRATCAKEHVGIVCFIRLSYARNILQTFSSTLPLHLPW